MRSDSDNVKNIILLRHAKTTSNEKKIYSGQGRDEGLSSAGRTELSHKMEGIVGAVKADMMLFSGPMKRCRETSELLFPGKDITIVESLKETDFGIFEGRSYDELKDNDDYIKWLESGGTVAPPGGESRDELVKRSIEGFYEALRLSRDCKNIMIVCHGGNIMALFSHFTGKGFYDHHFANLEGIRITAGYFNGRLSDITYVGIFCGDMA